ncbi:hypothetical protein AAMO2058_000840300 [Amorphochlora amoebiformis]
MARSHRETESNLWVDLEINLSAVFTQAVFSADETPKTLLKQCDSEWEQEV